MKNWSNEMDLVKVGVMGLHEAKTFKQELEKLGVELVLNHNEQTCTRGCSITVEILAKESDLSQIQKMYQEKYEKLLEGLDVNVDQMNSVFDTSQSEAICPACGHNFSTSNTECPDCGLVLG